MYLAKLNRIESKRIELIQSYEYVMGNGKKERSKWEERGKN